MCIRDRYVPDYMQVKIIENDINRCNRLTEAVDEKVTACPSAIPTSKPQCSIMPRPRWISRRRDVYKRQVILRLSSGMTPINKSAPATPAFLRPEMEVGDAVSYTHLVLHTHTCQPQYQETEER